MAAAVPAPTKVVAMHLDYRSRAAERGRAPTFPSYFLTPVSSIAASGAAVCRPQGCGLLAFEGEIALVIGTPARNIPPEQGWKHVGRVTAANDFGVYDLRSADAGANVRLGRHHVPWETDVACAGALVQPGDLLVGDADGVVVLPDTVVAEIVAASVEQEREERRIAEQVRAGASVDGLYPMNDQRRHEYDAWTGTGSDT